MGSDVLLGHTEDGESVLLRYDHRTAHVAILGKSGFGKTTLLEHLVLGDMRDGTAAIVIDAHGDLTKRLVSLAPSDARNKIVLIEPNEERPFGLNLYAHPDPVEMRSPETAVDHIMEIFNKLMGAEAGYRSIIDPGLRNSARLLIANGLTMAELPLLYSDAAFRRRALLRVENRYVHDYWRDYDQCPPREQQQRRDPILNKVSRFLEDDRTLLMVAQPTTIPIRQVMDEGGILLLNLAGLGRSTISLLGMILLAAIEKLFHERERVPEQQRKRVHLYLDEYGRFETPTARQMLAECRKYGLGATIAYQDLTQTPEKEALKVESLISFQLGAEDAYAAAGSFDCTPIRMKKVARQRTEPQYREREEEIWDSERSHTLHEGLCRDLEEAESDYRAAQTRKSDAWQILTALFPTGGPWGKDILQSSDGTLHGVRLLQRLDGVGSTLLLPRARFELREMLKRLYEELGREPQGEELLEAKEWIHHTATICERAYEELDASLPTRYERCAGLRSMIERHKKQHTTRQQRTEYIGETPVKDQQGRVIYDNIEEIDQSHADRRAEIANMLTQLPRYLVYCKLLSNENQPHEYKIETRPPATVDSVFFDDQLERAVRISKKVRGTGEIKLDHFGSMSPEVGFTFKPKEFQETIAGFMQDIRYDVRSYGNEPSPELRVEEVRERSRKQYGTPRSQVEEQIRKRQMRPPPDDGQPVKSSTQPKGPPPPVSPPPPSISRRSPKR
ncbi:type IV secretory system conjugative DNA transfer family protein [Streptomyces yangpuensis]|uniref:type IV secretory system conjugative DNA transfer family protein n=1 Tax=Streptomyces yangpuensis TaxID=1648182 RepID=UPI0036589628